MTIKSFKQWKPIEMYIKIGRSTGVEIAVATLLSIVMFYMVWNVGRLEYPGYDFGPMADNTWRLLCGQVPFVDFDMAFPFQVVFPMVYLGKIRGHLYSNAALSAAIFGSLSFLSILYAARSLRIWWLIAWLMSFSLWFVAFFYFGFVWHTPSAYASSLVLLLSVLVQVFKIPCSERRHFHGLIVGAIIVVSFAFCLWSKPNIGWPTVIFTVIVALGGAFNKRDWGMRLIGFLLCGLGIAFVIPWVTIRLNLAEQYGFWLRVSQGRPSFFLIERSYVIGKTGVFRCSFVWWEKFWTTYTEFLLVVLIGIIYLVIGLLIKYTATQNINEPLYQNLKQQDCWVVFTVALGLFIASATGVFFSSDSVAPAAVCALWSFIIVGCYYYDCLRGRQQAKIVLLLNLVMCAVCLLLLQGRYEQSINRDRVKGAGERRFWGPSSQRIAGTGFFEGSRVWSGLEEANEEAMYISQQFNSVYFGPRIEHMYGNAKNPRPEGVALRAPKRGWSALPS